MALSIQCIFHFIMADTHVYMTGTNIDTQEPSLTYILFTFKSWVGTPFGTAGWSQEHLLALS